MIFGQLRQKSTNSILLSIFLLNFLREVERQGTQAKISTSYFITKDIFAFKQCKVEMQKTPATLRLDCICCKAGRLFIPSPYFHKKIFISSLNLWHFYLLCPRWSKQDLIGKLSCHGLRKYRISLLFQLHGLERKGSEVNL